MLKLKNYLHHPRWRGQGGAGGVCDENGSAGQMLSRLNVTSLDFTGHPPIKHSIEHSTGRLKSVKCLKTVKFLLIQLPYYLSFEPNHLHFSTSKTNLRLWVWWFWSEPSVSFWENVYSMQSFKSFNAS